MLKNVLLAIGSVVVALIAFELLLSARPDLRADNASPKFVFCQGDTQRYRQDAVFRKAEIPGSIYFENNGEGWSIHLNNERGFRDIFDSGDQHAIILGDSFTRGTSVNDHQTIPYLLDAWHPDIAFHSFATGGSGTADAYRAYQAIAQDWDHRLVILNYFSGNDLRNNLAGDITLEGDDGNEVQLGEVQMASAPKRLLTRYHRLMRANSHVYNLAYTSARIMAAGRKGDRLPPDQLALGAEITKGLLFSLGREAARHDADLLVVIIPSWNEIMERGAEDDPDLQRRIIGQVAGELDNVFVLDLTNDIRALGARRVYGQVDKHFNPLGAYTAAKATYEWMHRDWPRGPRTNRTAPAFDDDRWGVEGPDCDFVERYRERLLNTAATTHGSRAVERRPVASNTTGRGPAHRQSRAARSLRSASARLAVAALSPMPAAPSCEAGAHGARGSSAASSSGVIESVRSRRERNSRRYSTRTTQTVSSMNSQGWMNQLSAARPK